MLLKTFLLRPLVGLLILGLLFHVLENLAHRRARSVFSKAGLKTDLLYFFLAPAMRAVTRWVILVPVLALVLTGITTLPELKNGLYRGFGPLGRQPPWLQAVEVLVLVDFVGYWTHRAFHSSRGWRIHAIHHSSEELDWIASARVHPLNELVNRLGQATPVLMLGFDPKVTLAAAPFLTLYAIGLHANLDWDFGPLRKVIASPVFHRWHHSREPEALDKNFAGLLPLWDLLFGTFHMPPNRLPRDFGTTAPVPDGFLAQLAYPFRSVPSATIDAEPSGQTEEKRDVQYSSDLHHSTQPAEYPKEC
jgi:sterol desaturase/sphingolipid hydroxylase (fatty acid hydroxylase superfamily)